MRRSTKVVVGFAVAGFILPLLLLTIYFLAGHFDRYPNMVALFDLCPTSIMSMPLDHASVPTAVIVWLIISLSNAVVYAVVPFAIVLVYRIFKPSRSTHGPWSS